jgi:hypothetical protein
VKPTVLAIALILAVVAPTTAQANEFLQLWSAESVSNYIARERERKDPYGWGYGTHGCHRLAARTAKCRSFYKTFRGADRTDKYLCEWITVVKLEGGQFLAAPGPQRCHPL